MASEPESNATESLESVFMSVVDGGALRDMSVVEGSPAWSVVQIDNTMPATVSIHEIPAPRREQACPQHPP